MKKNNGKILAIIPARGGSKGIKDKNIVDICGKPLIAYTIEPAIQALQEGIIDKLIISTDSERIASIAKRLGADVPFIRPREISGDRAKSLDYILHALDFFSDSDFDAVMILQPTSPLRAYEDIKNASILFETGLAPSLISCYREGTVSELIMYKKKGKFAQSLTPSHSSGTGRQKHDAVYIRNGAIYITLVEYLKKEKRIISDTPLMLEMPKSRSLNLDTSEDLIILRRMLCK